MHLRLSFRPFASIKTLLWFILFSFSTHIKSVHEMALLNTHIYTHIYIVGPLLPKRCGRAVICTFITNVGLHILLTFLQNFNIVSLGLKNIFFFKIVILTLIVQLISNYYYTFRARIIMCMNKRTIMFNGPARIFKRRSKTENASSI